MLFICMFEYNIFGVKSLLEQWSLSSPFFSKSVWGGVGEKRTVSEEDGGPWREHGEGKWG